jgi:hypothetical protein
LCHKTLHLVSLFVPCPFCLDHRKENTNIYNQCNCFLQYSSVYF